MELREFVKSSLVQIADGVAEAQVELKTRGIQATVNPHYSNSNQAAAMKTRLFEWNEVQHVEFDVAVSASESKETDIGGKISIIVANIGTDKGIRSEVGALNRIRFKVPMTLPSDRERGS